MSGSGRIISHTFSRPVPNALMTGIKFLDPKGGAFAVTAYDSDKIQIFTK